LRKFYQSRKDSGWERNRWPVGESLGLKMALYTLPRAVLE
jgi:hypothetical protein